MALHKDITGSDNHEPKGVETASAGQVYTANGSGSGSWTTPGATGYAVVCTSFADISAPSTVYFSAPVTGTIVAVYITLQSAITVANSVVTGAIAGSPIGGLSLTVTQSGSAAGSVFSDTSLTGASVTAGQSISLTTDGGSTTTAVAHVEVVFSY